MKSLLPWAKEHWPEIVAVAVPLATAIVFLFAFCGKAHAAVEVFNATQGTKLTFDPAGNAKMATGDATDTGALTSTTCVIEPADTGCRLVTLPGGGTTWSVDVRGTWVATLQFEGTLNGTNWFSVSLVPADDPGGTSITSTTANGQWKGNVGGLQKVRVRASAYTSGSATVVQRVSVGPSTISTVGAAGTQTVAFSQTGTNNDVDAAISNFPTTASTSAISVRCVNAAGSAFESCAGAGGSSSGKIIDGTAAGEADVIGSAPAGTEQGLVVRNIPSGTQAVSGTVTSNQGTSNTNAQSWWVQIGDTVNGPADVTSAGYLRVEDQSITTPGAIAPSVSMMGIYDGTNGQRARGFDLDTGAGAQYAAGVSLRKAASGGSVEAGTSTDPLRVDPTGTTTQPVSGTVSVNSLPAGTNNIGDVDVLSLPAISISQTTTSNDVDVSNFPTTASTSAVSIRCVNTAGTAFEACGGGGGGGGSSHVDNAAFTTGTTSFTTAGGLVDDILGTNAAEDSAAAVRISPERSMYVELRSGGVETGMPGNPLRTSEIETVSEDFDTSAGQSFQKMMGIALPSATGPASGGTATNPLRVNPTGTTAQPVTDNGGSLTVDGTVTANAGTGPFPVSDNGGSLTVDGTVAATQSGTWTVQPGNTANTTAWLTKLDQTSANNDVDVLSLPAISISQTTTSNDVDANVTNFPTTASTSAISVRCVNAAGSAFESCAGTGGGGGGANGSTTGTLTASGQSVTLAIPDGASSCTFEINGTWDQTLIFERSANGGTDYRQTRAVSATTNVWEVSPDINSDDAWMMPCGGFTHVRVRATAAGGTPGTANVAILASAGALPAQRGNTLVSDDGGAVDGNAARVLATAPASTDRALVTRPISPAATAPLIANLADNTSGVQSDVLIANPGATAPGLVVREVSLADRSGTGTITALNGTVQVNNWDNMKGTCIASVTGTWVATLSFQVEAASTLNYQNVSAYDVNRGAWVEDTQVNGVYAIPCAGMSSARVQATAFTSGTVNVTISATAAAFPIGGPVRTRAEFYCKQSAITATTQCQGVAATGQSHYITSFSVSSTDAKQVYLRAGTGTNCATGIADLTPQHYVPASGGYIREFKNALRVGTGSAICCSASAATAFSCDISGYTAP